MTDAELTLNPVPEAPPLVALPDPETAAHIDAGDGNDQDQPRPQMPTMEELETSLKFNRLMIATGYQMRIASNIGNNKALIAEYRAWREAEEIGKF